MNGTGSAHAGAVALCAAVVWCSSAPGQSCGEASSGDCCTAHAGTACNDAACCAAICATDASCCQVAWDGICAGEATATCAVCDAAGCLGVVNCNDMTLWEDEFCLFGDFNGGCVNPLGLVTPVSVGDVICGQLWADAGECDTDVYEFVIAQSTRVECFFTGEIPGIVSLATTACPDPVLLRTAQTDVGECSVSTGYQCLSPGIFRVIVKPKFPGGFPCKHGGFVYRLAISDGGSCGCPGDIDGNGVTNAADLGILLGGWGSRGATDLNGDGTTDGADLGLLLGCWTV